MAQLNVSAAARSDIRAIIDYLEQHAGRRIALRFALEFDAMFDRIAEMPGIGSPRAMLGDGVRMAMVAPYLIFYETGSAGDVRVLRVLHWHRNITRDLISGS
jgi:plasmid stabilization system protein ParE